MSNRPSTIKKEEKSTSIEDQSTQDSSSANGIRRFFSIPSPIRVLFDKVPIIVYPQNDLPQRAQRSSRVPNVYVFSTEKDAAAGQPSFNPSCLKWQTFLNIAGVDHRLTPSNNHASPSGALPFLLPASSTTESLLPVVSNKFIKYAKEQGAVVDESPSLRYEAYQSLLDHRIRNAWLYNLYIEPSNFGNVAYPLYVSPISANALVRKTTSYQLRAAAEAELLKHSSVIDAADLYSEADKAFEALSTLLGDNEWFFANEKPALFDASIFAYTHLLLDDGMGWKEEKLCRALKSRENLVQHRNRLLARYYGGP